MIKDAYCPMPFVTLSVNPNNWISRCMMSNESMGPLLKETYSNEKFQTLRTNMLNGQWDEDGCHSCWFKEKHGNLSKRKKWLSNEKRYIGTEGFYEQNIDIKRNIIKHLYMNFNNICNFKCRMCGPHYSNSWIPDYRKLGYEYDDNTNPKQQIDIDKFLNEYGPELGQLGSIWITGGEPFIDNSIFDFFDKLSTYCNPSNLNVLITTNASKLEIHKLKKLNNFNQLRIHVSVDATGDIYDYIRGYNYTWKELDKKVQELYNYQNDYNYILSVNGSFQIYNILDLETFWNWCTQYSNIKDIEHRLLTGPKFLQARHAKDSVKREGIAQALRLLEKYPNNEYLIDIIKELKQPISILQRRKFLEWNSKLDAIRGCKSPETVKIL